MADDKTAIDQIRMKGYHHRYGQGRADEIWVGMDISKKARNVIGFVYEDDFPNARQT